MSSSAHAAPGPAMGERTVGLVLVRPRPTPGLEPFMAELAAGIEEVLNAHDRGLLVHFTDDAAQELRIWSRWAAADLVAGVLIVEYADDDPRPAAAERLGLACALIGGPDGGLPIANVFVDDGAGARDALDALADLGHRRVARVTGPTRMRHTQARNRAFAAEAARLDIAMTEVEGDFTEAAGRDATRTLLGWDTRPTAIVYDNDLMAIGGLNAAAEAGLAVPGEVSVIAWDDTLLARLATPALSVVAVDIRALGRAAGEAILAALAGEPPASVRVPPPTIRLADSVGAAP